jgi:hypothetical protein
VDQVSKGGSDGRDHACFVPRSKHFNVINIVDNQRLKNWLAVWGGWVTAVLA